MDQAPSRPRHRLAIALALSILGMGGPAGLVALTAYGAVRGEAATAPPLVVASRSDLAASIRASGRAALVMVVHPGCSCTRASLHELQRILASQPAMATEVIIVFFGKHPEERIARELHELARSIPGARVIDDRTGEESWLGARTSGTVLFYDRMGALRFSGGITPSRGHEGDSAGGAALGALLAGEPARDVAATDSGPTSSPVFGCRLDAGRTEQ